MKFSVITRRGTWRRIKFIAKRSVLNTIIILLKDKTVPPLTLTEIKFMQYRNLQ